MSEGLRLTELMASLSLATDLGTGQPMGHALRTCLIAVSIARELGCDPDQVRTVHSFSLLRFLGCTADAAESAEMIGGDELRYGRVMAPALNAGNLDALARLPRAVTPGHTPWERGKLIAKGLASSSAVVEGLRAHCEVASMLAHRLGVTDAVTDALLHAYERWDGRGYPSGLEGDDLPIEISISILARDVDLWQEDRLDPRQLVTKRRGKAYDPEVADAFLGMEPTRHEAELDSVLDAEPRPFAYVSDIDEALTVLADFSDLKSPWIRAHSRRVSELAAQAAHHAGLGDEASATLRRAGLVHDLGRVGVPNGIWDKKAPLSTVEREQMQAHPYLTHRVLDRCPALAGLGPLASSHHERLDGSGYHRQLEGGGLSMPARLLAAADVLAALEAPRPHRPAFEPEETTTTLIGEIETGRLDRTAVTAVLESSEAHRTHVTSVRSASLTEREIEVLRLASRGLTNKEMANQLFLSPKTVGRHVENIYAKIGVTTRAAAAVYAMENGLL